uniref:Putative wd repeat domain 32 n=1 Tax=Rhipicephalus pulchellus TaxID=72859 RepID=L7MAA8_RHIPC
MAPKKVDFWGRKVDHQRLGLHSYIGANDHLYQTLYRALVPSEKPEMVHASHGGIFNLSFAPEGSILVAATEGKSILIFDPLNHKLIREVKNAHSDCVNYARFLDSRTFATCSDDTTVALWDVRNLKRKIRSLVGHSNWVKNIEYASAEGLLVTSGFDGSIHTWDINKFSENGTEFQRIFYTNGLMRMRLTPDNKKMVICTTGGYLVVIHDLNLHTLAYDLRGFKLPKMYRWRASEKAAYHIGDCSGHHFTARRNRVELICDFPSENDAEIISSLQVHPHGWCVLSRNTSRNEKSEWTCVHDIQEQPPQESGSSGSLSAAGSSSCEDRDWPDTDSEIEDEILVGGLAGGGDWGRRQPGIEPLWDGDWERLWMPPVFIDEESDDVPESRVFHVSLGAPNGSPVVSEGTMEEAMALLSGQPPLVGLQSLGRPGSSKDVRCKASQSRLLHYAQEPNRGRGWIKELCFSTDGRLVCSPLERGVRLLAFDSDFRELSDCVPLSPPRPLVHVLTNVSHYNYVVSTKFSPTHFLLASGCLNGQVCFHQPVL